MTRPVTGRDEALALLRAHLPVLRERFGVRDLRLFGSTARDEATAESDVDILVGSLDCEWSWGRSEAEVYLEALFGRKVDLVEQRHMRREYLPWVEAEAVDPLNPRPHMPNESRPKRWDVYIRDMLKYCREVTAFTAGMDYDAYLADERTLRAVSFNLLQIGELAGKAPPSVREAHPEIAWRETIGLRNRIAHAYYQIEPAKLWEIIQHHVPALAEQLEPLLAEAEAEAELED